MRREIASREAAEARAEAAEAAVGRLELRMREIARDHSEAHAKAKAAQTRSAGIAVSNDEAVCPALVWRQGTVGGKAGTPGARPAFMMLTC